MKKVENIDEYFTVVNWKRKENKATFTNCYLYQDEVQRLITKEKIFYEKVDGGILIYVDEMEYYQMYYYINVEAAWKIERKDKDIVIKNIYIEGRKNKKLALFEGKIQEFGFYLLDRLGQIECDMQILQKKMEELYPSAKNLFIQNGFTLIEPNLEIISQIRSFQKNIEEIPIYQIPYFDDEDFITFGKKKQIFCVLDKNGQLGAIKVFLEEKATYGYVAIKEEYQRWYGIAPVMSHLSMNYAKERKIKLLGWIADTNIKSIKYHMKIGYHWTGRYTDEWILKAK